MRYYVAVYCFENTDFLNFHDRHTPYITSHFECYLGLNMSQPFVLVISEWKIGQELSKKEKKGNKLKRTQTNSAGVKKLRTLSVSREPRRGIVWEVVV